MVAVGVDGVTVVVAVVDTVVVVWDIIGCVVAEESVSVLVIVADGEVV